MTGPDSAIALVFNEKAEILVVRQFRPSLGTVTIEFPAGAIDPGEKPIDAAVREVLEETGYKSDLFQLGDYFHLMMNRTNIKNFVFGGFAAPQQPNRSEEGVRYEWVARHTLTSSSVNGKYRQLAGLGILQLLSIELKLDVLTAPATSLLSKIHAKAGSAP